jgi:hypothetical protein
MSVARHSERSEESLFGLSPRKEGFLGTLRASVHRERNDGALNFSENCSACVLFLKDKN